MRAAAGRRAVLPPWAPGQRIGLYGGTFDPPHQAHAYVAVTALRRLRLDRLWVLATPGNPLKPGRAPSSFAERRRRFAALLDDPRVVFTDVEAHAGLRFSRDTVATLQRHAPGVRFVWIMGADGLAAFHRWRNWRDLARRIPIAVVDRPGYGLAAVGGPAASALGRWRVAERDAPRLANRAPPAWVLLHARRLPHSSTALRAEQG